MKKIFLLGFSMLSILSFAKGNNTDDSQVTKIINSKNPAVKRVKINVTILGFHITGWIEWSASGYTIVHHDLYIEDPFNNVSHHVGKISQNEDRETKIEGILTDRNDNIIKMSDDFVKVLTEFHNTVLAGNYN